VNIASPGRNFVALKIETDECIFGWATVPELRGLVYRLAEAQGEGR
jgi:hypothetical protein